MKTRSAIIRVLVSALLVFVCAGCGKSTSHSRAASVSHSTKMTSSRVLLPPQGGQTIQPPQMMGDAYSLWSPLSGKERSKIKRLAARKFTKYTGANTNIQWLPPTETGTMQEYLYRLTEQRPELTEKVLRRASQYLPDILHEVQNRNLPLELACLPLVESAFEPQAVSHAGAAGMWQLMPATARRFGLTVTPELDERFDVKKSTAAALEYLTLLYSYFNDWPMALAAYNCGEGSMQRAVNITGETTLAGISQWCSTQPEDLAVLPKETARFVPSFVAAVIIMSKADTLGLAPQPLLQLQGATTYYGMSHSSETYQPLPQKRLHQSAPAHSSGTNQHTPAAIPPTYQPSHSSNTFKTPPPPKSKRIDN